MFMVHYTTPNGIDCCNIYESNEVEFFNKATFSPDTIIHDIVVFKVAGKSYAERKENARQLAIDFQLADCGGLSYYEYWRIGEYFSKIGRRYGLIDEFKENCIPC